MQLLSIFAIVKAILLDIGNNKKYEKLKLRSSGVQ